MFLPPSPHPRRSGARARTAALEAIRRHVDRRRRRVGELAARLDAMSPLAVLGRGYALVRRSEDGRVVRRATDVAVGDALDVQLAEGALGADVTRLEPADKADRA